MRVKSVAKSEEKVEDTIVFICSSIKCLLFSNFGVRYKL